jgi:hypothetical protein
MPKTPDELSRELSQQAHMHPDYFWSFMLIDASVMIRELAGLPALAPPPPPAMATPPARQPERPGRAKLQKPPPAAAKPGGRPALRPAGFFR